MATEIHDPVLLEKTADFLFQNTAVTTSTKTLPHSIRVAELLRENNAPQTLIMAAMLHDVVEDTQITSEDVHTNFGNAIGDIVDSLTIEKQGSYNQKLRNFEDSCHRAAAIGFGALAIRACDLVDNSRHHDASNPEKNDYLRNKFYVFMGIAKPVLVGTNYWPLVKEAKEENVLPLARFTQVND